MIQGISQTAGSSTAIVGTLTQCAIPFCTTTLTAVTSYTIVGTTPKYLLNGSTFNSSNVSLAALSLSANYAFSVFGTQPSFTNVFVNGAVNYAGNFTGYLITQAASTTTMSCVQINVTMNISSTSVIYLL